MPITEDADTVERLLGIGDEVETDDGVGVITNITLNAADYNGEWQLEPPSIEVKLDDGTTVHTCICSLKIPEDDDATELLHQEYDRLWPSMTDEVPEDADSLIPEGDEETRTGLSHRQRVFQLSDGNATESYDDLDDAVVAASEWYSYLVENPEAYELTNSDAEDIDAAMLTFSLRRAARSVQALQDEIDRMEGTIFGVIADATNMSVQDVFDRWNSLVVEAIEE